MTKKIYRVFVIDQDAKGWQKSYWTEDFAKEADAKKRVDELNSTRTPPELKAPTKIEIIEIPD